jgi:hypothetical protein
MFIGFVGKILLLFLVEVFQLWKNTASKWEFYFSEFLLFIHSVFPKNKKSILNLGQYTQSFAKSNLVD